MQTYAKTVSLRVRKLKPILGFYDIMRKA